MTHGPAVPAGVVRVRGGHRRERRGLRPVRGGEAGAPARHWRWAAFRDWCEERERLTAAECRAAYALGEAESDTNLGTAIMCRVLYERTCPADVREAAKGNARAVVAHAAEKTRG